MQLIKKLIWRLGQPRTQESHANDSKTAIFAHRGSKGKYPENTLLSFRAAKLAGADGIELDVHLSADGELVVIHDEKVDRTTNGTGLVREFTSAELKALDAGSWFAPTFQGVSIPTLQEVLTLLVDLSFTGTLNIEVKTDKFEYPGIEQKVLAQLAKQKWPFKLVFSSFNRTTLANLHALDEQLQLAYLHRNVKADIEWGLTTPWVSALHAKKTWFMRHGNAVREAEKPVRLWLMNDRDELTAAFRAQIAGVITDFPAEAQKIRQQVQ